MSFYTCLEHYQNFDFQYFFHQVTDADVISSLHQEKPGPMDFLVLLSPRAVHHLETLARKARSLTIQYFGRTIQLFIPLYISNHCTNQCVYCGFNHTHAISRRKLDMTEIENEARAISRTGMRHILFLTGESPVHTPMAYLCDAARLLRRYFASVAVEVYPLDVNDYQALQKAGVDAMTLFQETYNPVVYDAVHKAGRKKDFCWRLDAPARAAQSGMRGVNIGALLGLSEPRTDIFFTGLHARYLEDRFPDTEVAVSLPRFNAVEGHFWPAHTVDDRLFVQFITALRIFLPRVGMTLSTRENAVFRDRVLPLGLTRYSAGSSVGVGGYSEIQNPGGQQFEIADNRSVSEVAAAISALGYQPVYKDWDRMM